MAADSPAKLNLFLAVTNRRADGFHDLVSVAAPLAWGDTLTGKLTPDFAGFTLECSDPAVPQDESNLVLKAANAFREATGWRAGAHFHLAKMVPMGAGLGGGSSNAAATLIWLNRAAGQPLSADGLAALAAQLGSDCPLFLHRRPVVMRGRGERIEPLPPAAAARLLSRRILVFKPGFGIGTPWAYARLAAQAPASYLPAAEAEARLAAWIADDGAPAEKLLFNSFERVAFAKYPALPVLLDALRGDFRLATGMSGSGSACFALLPEDFPEEKVGEIRRAIGAAWGEDAMVIETPLL
jgi:4-diphosphocytidyl-2-C-methyl-D-erythritol kinase